MHQDAPRTDDGFDTRLETLSVVELLQAFIDLIPSSGLCLLIKISNDRAIGARCLLHEEQRILRAWQDDVGFHSPCLNFSKSAFCQQVFQDTVAAQGKDTGTTGRG